MDFTLTATLSEDINLRYPEFRVAFLAVPAEPYADEREADRAAEALVARVRDAHASTDELRGSAVDHAYRYFYRSMSLKAGQVSTPVKQRISVLNNGYRSVLRIVDVAMEIEYTRLVSFQVYDAAAVGSEVAYALATGSEAITTTRGERKSCKPRELILTAGGEVVHSVYYGNDARYMASAATEIALVRVMNVPGLDAEVFRAAVDEASTRLGALRELQVSATVAAR